MVWLADGRLKRARSTLFRYRKTMSQDLFSSLKNYANKLSNGEKTPAEIATALNSWLKESGDAIKEKIEFEVSQSVEKLGFAKQSDLDKLRREVEALKAAKKSTEIKSKNPNSKKTNTRKPAKRTIKKASK